MNKDLIELVQIYGTKSHKDVSSFLNAKSKVNITAILVDLMTEYYNDKNSSTLREFLLVSVSGFESIRDKIGYNGYRQASIKSKTLEYCEAKPKNINTNDWKGKSKLNGGGNFTDYSWKKLKRHKRENPLMLVGGFIDGKLIYIFRFKFKHKSFTNKIEHQLQRHFPDGDVSGIYLRSASFGLKEYKDIKDLAIEVFVSEKELDKYKKYITAPLFSILEGNIR